MSDRDLIADLNAWLADLVAYNQGHHLGSCNCTNSGGQVTVSHMEGLPVAGRGSPGHVMRHDALMARKHEILARIEAAEAAR